MPKVGLMDLGTLDALKKVSFVNRKQTTIQLQEGLEPVAKASENKDQKEESASPTASSITYPQPC